MQIPCEKGQGAEEVGHDVWKIVKRFATSANGPERWLGQVYLSSTRTWCRAHKSPSNCIRTRSTVGQAGYSWLLLQQVKSLWTILMLDVSFPCPKNKNASTPTPA